LNNSSVDFLLFTYSSIYNRQPPRTLHLQFHARYSKLIISTTIMRAVAIIAALLGCASVALASAISDGSPGSGVTSGCQNGELTCTFDETALLVCQAGAWTVKDVCQRGYSCSRAALACRRRPLVTRGQLQGQGVDTTSAASNIKNKVEKQRANSFIC
jgi:hypothetical protein